MSKFGVIKITFLKPCRRKGDFIRERGHISYKIGAEANLLRDE